MNDEHLAVRLREAVAQEAGALPGGQGGLADRLIRRTRLERRRRATGAGAVAALLITCMGATGLLLMRQGDDTLLAPDPASTKQVGPVMTVTEAGAVTLEMAAREGLDGTPQCQSEGLKPQPEGAGIAAGLTLYAAYLTDLDGLERWSAEYDGGYTVISRTGQAAPPGLIAICWFTGDEPRDLSVGGPHWSAPPTHQLASLQLRGPAETRGLRHAFRSSRPLPVLAPDPPTLAPEDPVSLQGLRVFPQPEGVEIVDQLPRRTPPPEVEPVDCTRTACADPNEETVVRAELTIDGERLDPRDVRELEVGQTADLTLTLEVERGRTIREIQLGLSSGSHGSGPDGPTGLGDVLLRQPDATGTESFEMTWTVPADARPQQLVLYYLDDKYQQSTSHSRTIGGVTAKGR